MGQEEGVLLASPLLVCCLLGGASLVRSSALGPDGGVVGGELRAEAVREVPKDGLRDMGEGILSACRLSTPVARRPAA